MKKIVFFVLFLNAFVSGAVFAQTTECKENFEDFKSKTISKSYDDALARLTFLREKCPSYNDTIYIYGEKVLKYHAEASRKEEDRQKFIESLLSLYADYQKKFPGSDSDAKRAMLLKEYSLAKDDEVYKILDNSFKGGAKRLMDHEAIQTYFMLYLQQYESAKIKATQDEFIDKYAKLTAHIIEVKGIVAAKNKSLLKKKEEERLTEDETQYVANAEIELDGLDAVNDNISLLAAKHFSCEKLEAYYKKDYEAYKTDANRVGAMVNVMYNNKCFSSPVLWIGAEQLFKINPNADNAYTAGMVLLRKRDLNAALDYFNKAVNLEPNPKKKAGLYIDIAEFVRNSDKATAKDYLTKATALDDKNGRPYILLAQMYMAAGADCGLNEFETKALNWLAIQTVKKAAVAEPKYQPTVTAMVEQFNENVPTKDDAKAAGIKKNATVTYGCWINETITVPNI